MRFRAIVTPQILINDTMSAVQATTGCRTNSVVDGAEPDHYGFVVSPAEYDALREEFAATYLTEATEVVLPGGGRATMGPHIQPKSIHNDRYLGWFWGNPLPALALVTDDITDNQLPAGGGYIVVRVPDLAESAAWDHLQDWEVTRLYGRVALRIALGTPGHGIGPGVHALYVVDTPLSVVIATLTL